MTQTASPAPAAAESTNAGFWDSLPDDLRQRESLRKFKDPAGLARSYLELESLLGRDNRVAVPADDAPQESWEAFFVRLGRPESPEGYDLGRPELPEEVFGQAHMAHFRHLAHRSGLSPRQAKGLLTGYAELVRSGLMEQQAMQERRRAGVLESLRREFGPELEAKMDLARRAAHDFGGQELLDFLQEKDLADDPRMLAAFIRAGEALREDRLRPGASPTLMLSQDEAKAEIARLHTDNEFQASYRDRLHPAHDASVERMRRLFERAYPEGGQD